MPGDFFSLYLFAIRHYFAIRSSSVIGKLKSDNVLSTFADCEGDKFIFIESVAKITPHLPSYQQIE